MNIKNISLTTLFCLVFVGLSNSWADDTDYKDAPQAEAAKVGKQQKRLERYKAKMKRKLLEKIDTDGDGVMSREEYLANAEQRFTKMDANGDGLVTPEEARAHHKALREKHREVRRKRQQAESNNSSE